MSVDEMKQEAIKKIAALNDEKLLEEILDHLARIDKGEPNDIIDFYIKIKKQYSTVLDKLAK